jgi:hypothetical protein
MPANRRSLVFIAALAVAAATLLGWQRHIATELRAEIDRQRDQAKDRARAQAESLHPAPAPVPAVDAEILAEQAAVAQLRTHLEAMQRRVREATAVRPAPSAETPPLLGNIVAFNQWKNAGQATPAAAFETALWASATGDIDTLAKLLVLDPDMRAQANALFARLPESERRNFGSAERLIAFLTAKDVPLGRATILNQNPSATGTQLTAQIFDAEGKQKLSLFSLRAEGDRWQLLVPPNALKRYTAWMQAPPSAILTPVTTSVNP